MTQSAKETDEQARQRLQRVAVQYHLEIEYIDFVSIEEVREALHQFDIGLLPERFDIVHRAKRWKPPTYLTTTLRQSRLR